MILATEDEAQAYIATLTDAPGLAKLTRLAAALKGENERQNLVARGTLDAVWLRHFADSAQLLVHAPNEPSPWLDLGSGAGFPGLVIAILRPDTRVVLAESRARRIAWLQSQVVDFALPNCEITGSRLELLESFAAQTISARAFAPMPKLVALAARFSTSDTAWLLPKGRSAAQEVSQLPKGIRHMFHVEQSLTDEHSGIVVGRGQPDLHP